LLNNLATLYRAEGRYGEAELLWRLAIAIDEKALGPHHRCRERQTQQSGGCSPAGKRPDFMGHRLPRNRGSVRRRVKL
jgi:hypothetical protein